MATLAVEQEETIATINSQAVQVEKDTREGYVSQDFTCSAT
jgi:t-SNARE complex subunit (syntaxin)